MFFFWLLRIIAAFLLAQLRSLHSGAHLFLSDQNLTSESDQSSVDCCKMPSLQLLNCWTCMIIKRWKYNPHERRCSPCMCVRARRALKLTSKGHFWVLVRPNDQIHIKHVKKTAGLKSIHLNTVYILKWTRTVGRNLCQYFVLKWQTASSMLNQRENHP